MKKIAFLAALGLLFASSGSRLVSGQTDTTIDIGFNSSWLDPLLFKALIEQEITPALPGIKINLQPISNDDYDRNLNTLVASGNAPDIFMLSGYKVQDYISNKISNEDKLIKALDNNSFNKSDYTPSLQQICTIGNVSYCIVENFESLVMYYNSQIFASKGAKEPLPTDKPEMFERKIRFIQGISGYYGACFEKRVVEAITNFANSLYPPWKYPQPVNESKYARAFNFYVKLIKDKITIPHAKTDSSYSNAIECLTGIPINKNKSATGFDGTWLLDSFDTLSKDGLQIGTSLLPHESSNGSLLVFSTVWAINNRIKNEIFTATVKVFKALTSEKTQNYMLTNGLGLGSHKSLITNDYFKKSGIIPRTYKMVFKAALSGAAVEFNEPPNYIREIFNAFNLVVYEGKNAQDALNVAQKNISGK